MTIQLSDNLGDFFRTHKYCEYYQYGYENRDFDEIWSNDYWEGDKELEIKCREHFELGKKTYETKNKTDEMKG